MARPPLILPTKTLAISIIFRAIPPWPMISPAMMKKGIARREKERTPWTICWTIAMRGIPRYMAVARETEAKA